jgi:hypothetical protein
MSYDERDSRECDNDMYAEGHLEGVLSDGTDFEVTWRAPLRRVDASFTHAFGVQKEWGWECIPHLATNEIEMLDLFTEVASDRRAKFEVKMKCWEAYCAGNYEKKEV